MTDATSTSTVARNAGGETHSPNKITVTVVYNGVGKEFDANLHEPAKVLLDKAIKAFHITTQPHILALYKEDGTEIPDTAKLGDAGVHEGSQLLLRPSAVKGGGRGRPRRA